ncbi:MAG: prolyl-tRNA synthetase associated domain-containing protein [Alphaproteobacteria bacterium]|nr:prolyl-tRNA synthetase associated domain-containing protein [Alphaproteobacteria bacterium]
MTGKSMENTDPLPIPPEKLLKSLDDKEISYTLYNHAPVFTVAESDKIELDMPGTHCRNLFLRDKKENMFLVVAANETQIDLKKLASLLDCGRLSFGSAVRLWKYLGIRQGSVNPFCIANDHEQKVNMILDQTMMNSNIVNYHPMDNAMTIGLAPADLIRFIEDTKHIPEILDLSPAAPETNQD